MKIKNYIGGQLWAIFFIPVVFLFLCLRLKFAVGPFFLGPNNDPSYLYLMNSIYILDGLVPGFVQHPGTVLQIFGAIIIKIFHLQDSFSVMVENVFRNPEFYLHSIYYSILALNTVTLMALGLYTWKKTKDPLLGLLSQSSALLVLNWNTLSVVNGDIPVVANVNAENFLVGITNLYALLLVKLYFDQKKNLTASFDGSAVLLGFIAAMGVVSKVIFAPWLLVPLVLLRSWREKGVFIIAFLVSFFLWIIPIIKNFKKFSSWVIEGITHIGLCGNGQAGFIDAHTFTQALGRLLHDHVFFFSAVGILGCVVVSSFFIPKSSSAGIHKDARRYLAVLCLTVFISLLVLTKQPYAHYVVPTLNFFGVICLFVFLTWDLRRFKWLLIVFLASMFIANGALSLQTSGRLSTMNTEILNFSKKVYSEYPNCTVCSYYRSSSPAFALQFADDNQGYKAYTDVLQKIYPGTVFYHYWSRYFHDGRDVVYYDELLRRSPCILMYGSKVGEQFNEAFLRGHQVDSVQSEALYAIDQLTVQEALQAFMAAKQLESLGRYPEAYEAARKSKELGLRDANALMESLLKMIMDKP